MISTKANQIITNQQKEILKAFSRALTREAHVLAQRPDLLWQQLYNRLQWEGEVVYLLLEPEFSRFSKSGAKLWLHLSTPFRESKTLIRILKGHSLYVNACPFSPDGQTIASGGGDKTLRLWDVNTGAEIAVLTGHTKNVTTCAFSPDGHVLVSASEDRSVRLWDVHTRMERAILWGHTDAVTSCAFSPDGSFLVSGSKDTTVRLWSIQTCDEIRIFGGHAKQVNSCAFSPDSNIIASASDDHTIRLWNLYTGTEMIQFQCRYAKSLCFSPDGCYLAAATTGMVTIWDIQTGEESVSYIKPGIDSCTFSPDGRTMAVSSEFTHNTNVLVFDVNIKKSNRTPPHPLTSRGSDKLALKPSKTLEGHTGRVRACSFSPDGKLLASASMDCTLRLWDAGVENEKSAFDYHTGPVESCVFSPDGSILATSSKDYSVRLWNTRTTAVQAILKGHKSFVSYVSFSPDQRTLASASFDKTLRLWDIRTRTEAALCGGHSDLLTFCDFSPDGLTVATASKDCTVRLWDAQNGTETMVLNGHTDGIHSCAFSPDGSVLASVSRDKTLRLWEVQSGKELFCISGCQSGHPFTHIRTYAFSPDGCKLICSSERMGVPPRIWDVHTGEEIIKFQCEIKSSSKVWSCAFSPDGNIVSAGDRIWEAHTGKQIALLKGHTRGDILLCSFSPTGLTLATVGQDNTIRIWDAQTGEPLLVFPCPGVVYTCAYSPCREMLAAGDQGGTVYFLEPVGLRDAPIIVTPSVGAQGLEARCPACQQNHPVEQDWLGCEFTCPTPGCGRKLRLNSFVLGAVRTG